MVWCRPSASHHLNQCWLDYRCICASLGLNELIAIDIQLINPINTWWFDHLSSLRTAKLWTKVCYEAMEANLATDFAPMLSLGMMWCQRWIVVKVSRYFDFNTGNIRTAAVYIISCHTLTKKQFSNTSANLIPRNKHLLEWSQHFKYCMYTLQIWHNEYSICAKAKTNESRKI